MQHDKTDNELIAEFMGCDTHQKNDRAYYIPLLECYVTFDNLKYHKSWNWLMPVVEKIEKDYHVTIRDRHCEIANADRAFIGREGNKLRSTYKAVVEFIKWYNNSVK